MRTKQEIFDIVAPGLLKQGARSETPIPANDNEVACAYRGEDGRKCAAGMLIPDDAYYPEIEGRPVYCLPPDILSAMGLDRDQETGLSFVRDLQSLHDNREPHEWKARLMYLAARNHLSTECIKEWING